MDTIIILHWHGELFTQAIEKTYLKANSSIKSKPQIVSDDDQDASRLPYSIVLCSSYPKPGDLGGRYCHLKTCSAFQASPAFPFQNPLCRQQHKIYRWAGFVCTASHYIKHF